MSMKKQILFLSLILILINLSCTSRYENKKIIGCWEVNFSDTTSYTKQILHFQDEAGNLQLTIDEPSDGLLGMPGENPFFANDSLHYESLWGLFNYDGKFVSGDSVIKGIRTANNQYPISFIMRRVSEKELTYKIPRINADGKRVYNYSYNKPLQKNDGLECSTLSAEGIDSIYIYKLVEDILNGKMATVHSLLISKDNKLVFEEYFHNYHSRKLHLMESVTKSFTSALMGIAIDKQFIPDVNEPVLNYLTKWDSTQWVKKEYDIRIKNLLTMTAGLDWKPFTPNEYNDDVNIYISPDYIAYILNKDLKNKPGEKFFYNNRIMFLQGYLIEKSTGLSVDSFATKYLFNELGVKQHTWKKYDNGITETGGGLKLFPRDMMKFGLMYLNNGKWQGKQIVSHEWIKSSTEKHVSTGDQYYGYNWWIKNYNINNSNYNVYYALGHGEQTIMIIPSINVVFVMTAGNYFQAPQKLNEIMTEYILPSFNIQNKHHISRDDIVGNYKTSGNEIIIIELVDNNLIATDPSGTKLKLIPKSSNYYFVENSNLEVKFIKDNTGKIINAEIYDNGQRVDILSK